MLETSRVIDIQIERETGRMVVRYTPRTERTIYDLCDLNGRVIQTGAISDNETVLDISTLNAKKYVMLIVDGDQVISKRVNIAA
ncbi:MAG: hypothetical protein HKN79_01420 [Flavobacteriales bacterium]|nr:hypothetical protein [Flavobacteriales bacterium]